MTIFIRWCETPHPPQIWSQTKIRRREKYGFPLVELNFRPKLKEMECLNLKLMEAEWLVGSVNVDNPCWLITTWSIEEILYEKEKKNCLK